MGLLNRLRFFKKPFGKAPVKIGLANWKGIKRDIRGSTGPLIEFGQKKKALNKGDRAVIDEILKKEGHVADVSHLNIGQMEDRLHAIEVRKSGRLPKIVAAGQKPKMDSQQITKSAFESKVSSLNPQQMREFLGEMRRAPLTSNIKTDLQTGLVHPDSYEYLSGLINKVKKQVQ